VPRDKVKKKTSDEASAEEQAFVGEKSPFGRPHDLGKKYIEVKYAELWKNYRPRGVLNSNNWAASIRTQQSGQIKKLIKPRKSKKNPNAKKDVHAANPMGYKAQIIDCVSLETVTIQAADLLPVPNHNEFLRNVGNNNWFNVTSRNPGFASLRPVLLKMKPKAKPKAKKKVVEKKKKQKGKKNPKKPEAKDEDGM